MSTPHTLDGKNVLVAARAKNLGGLISRQLAEAGANVAIHYNSESTRPAAKETLAAVEATGGKGVVLMVDLTSAANVERLFADAAAALGPIDVAVNTVGKVLRKPITETTEEEYDSMADVNAKSAYFFIKEAGRTLNEGGKACNVTHPDLAARRLHRRLLDLRRRQGSGGALHHAGREGVRRAWDLGQRGGPRPDGHAVLLRTGTPERVEYHKSQALGGQLTKIEDIALVRFLATEGWWITGQTIFANGGYTTR